MFASRLATATGALFLGLAAPSGAATLTSQFDLYLAITTPVSTAATEPREVTVNTFDAAGGSIVGSSFLGDSFAPEIEDGVPLLTSFPLLREAASFSSGPPGEKGSAFFEVAHRFSVTVDPDAMSGFVVLSATFTGALSALLPGESALTSYAFRMFLGDTLLHSFEGSFAAASGGSVGIPYVLPLFDAGPLLNSGETVTAYFGVNGYVIAPGNDSPPPVPLPAGALLLPLGLGALALLRRRRRA